MHRPALKWLAAGLATLLLPPLLALLWVAVFGWNWARVPLQDLALQKTGRELRIGGELEVDFGWLYPRLRAQTLSFANPPWAAAPHMVLSDAAEISIDLRQLLRGRLAFPEVRLLRPRVFLEQGSGGRKNWLLDRAQTDETMRLPIGRVLLDQGQIHYTDSAQQTAIEVDLATVDPPAGGTASGTPAAARSLVFTARGGFRGQALAAQGSGGAVLAWLDETQAYPLQVQAALGKTRLRATGTVTSLLKATAVDLQLSLSGDSLASLFPLIGVALPPTPAYRSTGHLVRQGTQWRYEAFAGQVGHSDMAGTLQVDSAGARPLLTGSVTFRQLDLADLGPAVGVRAEKSTRVLPDLPFNTARWAEMDADVSIQALRLLNDEALLVEQVQARVQLHDRKLMLDPLVFGLAGGRVKATVALDAATEPLSGHAKAQLRGLMLGRLLAAVGGEGARLGRLDGELDLKGRGASVGRLLATADGQLRLVARNGQISRLLMEQTGLHLLEILRLNLRGDQIVAMNCAVADFKVVKGVMQVRKLVLDTEVNTLAGNGHIDLAQEQFALAIVPRTKVVSLVALRSPIYIKGSFAKPQLDVDRGRILARGSGALLLGMVNPLLALIPLLEPGPGMASPCGDPASDPRPAQPRAPS